MYLNQRLKLYFFDYLSKIKFKSCEFKKIFDGFTYYYPEFDSYSMYQKVYRLLRLLAEQKLVLVNGAKYRHKYTSNYNCRELYLFFENQENFIYVNHELQQEEKELKNEIIQKELEIFLLDMYIKAYPRLKDRIQLIKLKNEKQLAFMESKSNVLHQISTTF